MVSTPFSCKHDDRGERCAKWCGSDWSCSDGEIDHEHEELLAALAAEQARAERAEAALRAVKIRLHFDGWPGETMWNAGTDESPRWVADWRHEISLIENALHGTPITTPDNLADTRKRCELPALAIRPSGDGVAK